MFAAMADADQITLSDVLDALYGGLLDAPPWERFLRALARWLDASYATLILTAPGLSEPGTIVTPGGDPKTNQDYLASFFATDPFQGLPEGRVVSFAEFVGNERAPEIADYMGFLAGAGGDQVLGVDLRFDSGFEARCRATRDQSLPDFSTAQRERLTQLVPHLRNAARIFERLELSGAEHGVYRGAVEQLGVGTIILDQHGRIARSNAVADRLIQAADGIAAIDGRLKIADRALHKLLAAQLAQIDQAPPPLRFKITRDAGGDLAVVARAMPIAAMMRGGAALALFVSVPDDAAQLDPAAIQDLFQLTRMEARLATALASGGSLTEAADRLGIAHNTARAHLRAIFAKTGARRQSQLVHLLRSGMQ